MKNLFKSATAFPQKRFVWNEVHNDQTEVVPESLETQVEKNVNKFNEVYEKIEKTIKSLKSGPSTLLGRIKNEMGSGGVTSRFDSEKGKLVNIAALFRFEDREGKDMGFSLHNFKEGHASGGKGKRLDIIKDGERTVLELGDRVFLPGNKSINMKEEDETISIMLQRIEAMADEFSSQADEFIDKKSKEAQARNKRIEENQRKNEERENEELLENL